MTEDIRPLVLDFGSGLSKIGFAGDLHPQLIYQSCVQQTKYYDLRTHCFKSSIFVGNEDLADGHLTFPIEHGIVTDWVKVESLWMHAFEELKVKPEDHVLLLTESPLNPKINREKIAEIMFEKYQVPALYFANTAKMCADTLGVSTGVILELGDGVTAAVPIEDGEVIAECVQRNDFAGKELTKYLRKLLENSGRNEWSGFTSKERFSKKSGIRDVVRKVKEKLCYVAQDVHLDMKNEVEVEPCVVRIIKNEPMTIYLKIGGEMVRCPEVLFEPTKLALSAKGIHELVINAIEKCDADLRDELYSNIVLCGGTAQLPGLVQRIKKEMLNLVTPDTEINVTKSLDLSCAWTGASGLASSAIFRQMCTNKDKYDELGTHYLHEMAERKSHLNLQAFKFLR